MIEMSLPQSKNPHKLKVSNRNQMYLQTILFYVLNVYLFNI